MTRAQIPGYEAGGPPMSGNILDQLVRAYEVTKSVIALRAIESEIVRITDCPAIISRALPASHGKRTSKPRG